MQLAGFTFSDVLGLFSDISQVEINVLVDFWNLRSAAL